MSFALVWFGLAASCSSSAPVVPDGDTGPVVRSCGEAMDCWVGCGGDATCRTDCVASVCAESADVLSSNIDCALTSCSEPCSTDDVAECAACVARLDGSDVPCGNRLHDCYLLSTCGDD